jgi:tetratricopeptide (TPR) repeat protein
MGHGDDEVERPLEGSTRSVLSGAARDVVQARDISGGIHFHASAGQSERVPRQLPGDVHGFVNRTADLGRLDALLAADADNPGEAAVCVIAGTAGVGKTSLAVHWARRHYDRFPDGQLYVNLRGYDPGQPVTAAEALERFLTALGITPGAVPDDLESRSTLFRSLMADRRMLVVLDNAASAGQVRPLLPGADGCLVLVTSRSRLSGLVARDGAHRVTLDVFPEREAVELLKVVTSAFRGEDSDVEVAELARLCARLPLALRIAAERAAARPHTPLTDLIQDLRDESSLWDALSSEDDEEADAVRTVFAWSYRALPVEAARMFRLVGLHPGPDFSGLAAAALADVPPSQARRLLDTLVGVHMLGQTGQDRYQFHDLLRAYAIEQATREESTEDRGTALLRVCTWYLRAMGAAAAVHDAFYCDDWGVPAADDDGATLPAFSTRDAVMTWFDEEVDNLVAAARVAAETGFDEIAWKLPALFRTPYLDRHPVEEWLPMGQRALASARRSPDGLGTAITYTGLGIAYRQAQRIPEAIASHQAALAAARDVGDRRQEAAALVTLGHAFRSGRRLGEALQSYEEGLAVAEDADLTLWTPWATIGMTEALFDAGRLDEARDQGLRLMASLQAQQSPGLKAELLWILAAIERESGDTSQARSYIHDALDIATDIKNAIYEGEYETELGRILLAAGEPHEALVALQRAASIQRRRGDRSLEAEALHAAAGTYRILEQFDEAIDFHRTALSMQRGAGSTWALAVTLNDLAAVLDDLQRAAEAVPHFEEARQLLLGYEDLRASTLRASITSRLGDAEASADPVG